MIILDFPASVPIRHAPLWLSVATAGMRGLDGERQVLFTENRYWIGDVTLPPLTRVQAMACLALSDELRGRARVLRLHLPNPGANPDVGMGPVTFSDGARFDDGALFAGLSDADPVVVEDAAAGASFVRLDNWRGRSLMVGAWFSAGGFLYRVSRNDDGWLRFNPPLRAPLASGETVRVRAPYVLVRLTDDTQFRNRLQYGLYTEEITFQVEEVLKR
ncbi:hypothetical protein [Ponticoccus alexandrii]|uniref:Uncharacterized protein n=1 Tax=Ponticoccus alexandrii TaxID=1943633 RepID=A0ABX7F831_9RHOB|nr:hypothetical protein [Ponticoccus alexandrii]QRF66385.1 hypothetical protein GQA70_08720 [Ponticoccus alexandrii]